MAPYGPSGDGTSRHGPRSERSGEVSSVTTFVYATPAPAFHPGARVQASAWRLGDAGTRMPMTAGRLRGITPSNVRTCAANAARDAATKTAVGGQAFEDPV